MGGCRDDSFTSLTSQQFAGSLGQQLISTVDQVRDIRVQLGLRPYNVWMVRTVWTGERRGQGVEQVKQALQVLPTPMISDLTGLQEILQPVGLEEVGAIMLSEVSGSYTEDMLRGQDPQGTPVGPAEAWYYEIEFISPNNQPAVRRRFQLRSAPSYQADSCQWVLRLEKAIEDRDRRGEPR